MKNFFLYFFLSVFLVSALYNVAANFKANSLLRMELNRKNIQMDNQETIILKQRELLNNYEIIMRKMKDHIEDVEKGLYYQQFRDRIT